MASTTTSRRRTGLHVRCTPASRNIHTSNCAQKAQIQTSCDGQSVFTVTFRCPKPKGRGPVFSEQQVRAAKLRFIMMWLPHLRGVSVSMYESYVREFETVYRAKGYDAGIGRLVEKQQRLQTRKLAEAKGEHFRTPEEVAAFHEAAAAVLSSSAPTAAAVSAAAAKPMTFAVAPAPASSPVVGAVAFRSSPVAVDEADMDLDMGVATEIESVSGSSYTSGTASPLPYSVSAYSAAPSITNIEAFDDDFLASFIAEEEGTAGDAGRFAAAVVAGAAAAGVLPSVASFEDVPAAPADAEFTMDVDDVLLGGDDLFWDEGSELFADPMEATFFDL